jgi:hypothetical protein
MGRVCCGLTRGRKPKFTTSALAYHWSPAKMNQSRLGNGDLQNSDLYHFLKLLWKIGAFISFAVPEPR